MGATICSLIPGGGIDLARRAFPSISRSNGDVVSASYDSAGRLASVSSAARTVTTKYSPATGNLASLAAPDFGTLSYAYDGPLCQRE